MALPCYSLARTGSQANPFAGNELRDNGKVTDSDCAEYAAIPLDFRRRPQCLGKIVGKLYRGTAFHVRDFADQADGVKATATARIATAEVVRKQRHPNLR